MTAADEHINLWVQLFKFLFVSGGNRDKLCLPYETGLLIYSTLGVILETWDRQAHLEFVLRFRYERLLRRAKTEDLSEVSGIGCLYQCGVDRYGRPVIIFVGKWFKFKEINLDKVGCVFFHSTDFDIEFFSPQALLYLIYLLDPLVKNDYIIIYFHTNTTAANHPSFSWLREVYNVLPYKYKKNLKGCYIVHPTIWTKVIF